MSWFHQAKQFVKPIVASFFSSAVVQTWAVRGTYLARFRRWCATHSCPEVSRFEDLHARALQAVPAGPIHYLEFGVYQGDSLRLWLGQNHDAESRFVGFDTFQGLPEDWSPTMRKGTFSTEGQLPNVNDERCSFQVGMFQDTLPSFLRENELHHPLIVHLDADLYSSTLFVLITLAPLLQPGDLLIFDEFQDYLDEFRAFQHFRAAFPFDYEVVGHHSGYTRVVMRITRTGPTTSAA